MKTENNVVVRIFSWYVTFVKHSTKKTRKERLVRSVPYYTLRSVCHLIGGSIQVGQGDIEQIVLQRVDPCRDGQLHGLQRFVHYLLLQESVHQLYTETWRTDGGVLL